METHLKEMETHLNEMESHSNEMESHLNEMETHLNGMEPHLNEMETHLNEMESHLKEIETRLNGLEPLLNWGGITHCRHQKSMFRMPELNDHLLRFYLLAEKQLGISIEKFSRIGGNEFNRFAFGASAFHILMSV